MGEINIVDELREDNEKASLVELEIYSNALRIYCEAAKNIKEHGAITAHPRTGSPIDNPYLKVQEAQGRVLSQMRRINGDRVLELLTR